MRNRFVYIFLKAPYLIWEVAVMIMVVVLAAQAFRLESQQVAEMKALQDKKQLIAQIPQFEAQLQKVADNQGLLLNGIIFNTDLPLAIINNTVMKVGEEISGQVVQSISPSSVVLVDKNIPGKTIELSLEEQ